MAGEQIIQSGLIVGRTAGAAITIVPTTDSTSTILFDDRSGDQTSEIKFDHLTNIYTHKIGTTTQFQITSTGVTIAGDLIVNGTTITVNATDLVVTDKVILVNKDEVLVGVGNGTGVAGIEVERGSLANTDWLFNESNDWWGTSGAIQTLGNIAKIDSTLASEQVLTITANGAVKAPIGTTAERPATPSDGMIRYNSTLNALEGYGNAIWNILSDAPVLFVQRGYIDGLILSNGTDTAHDIDISPGLARDDSNTDNMEITSVLVKQIDAPWVVGTAAGGNDQLQLDGANTVTFTDNGASPDFVTIDAGTWTVTPLTGDTLVVVGGTNAGSYQITTATTTVITVATGSFLADAASTSAIYVIRSDTWYHTWLIRRNDTGVVDILFSESATAPTMPASYDQKRRIGAVFTDSSANIIAFFQDNDTFYWVTRPRDVSTTSPGTSANLPTMTVPTGLKVEVFMSITYHVNSNHYLLVTSPDETDSTPSATIYDIYNNVSSSPIGQSNMNRLTNTSAQIRYRSSIGAVSIINIWTIGWKDPRGRNV